MFVSVASACPRAEHLKGAWVGSGLLQKSVNYGRKRFIVQAPGHLCNDFCYAGVVILHIIKIECLYAKLHRVS
jgi:hypothetical protein